MVELTDQTFQAQVSQGLWIVDFWSKTCAPCRVVTPILEDLEREYGQIKFGAVEATEELRTALSNRVISFPTVISYVNGRPVSVLHGAQPARVFRSRAEELLSYLPTHA
ncbi:thioredoxin family protein [Deinococcus hopiensis]|uniref:Thioredoxin n=1 Tax=Deinococcus hopiensis KR-140 TaxID=695939 RepID=A0A1W1U9R8_9DEIO|nr:thioredoxin family protein [Deinococcus hopiensis]SMB77828.1 thioredoxin [Deinococcus hopiensis KR-140]